MPYSSSKMSRKLGKRAKKVPASFKDFVSADVQERPMLEEGKYLC